MRRNAVVIAVLVFVLSGCTTLYSTNREWKLPAGLGDYVIAARMDVGLLTRKVTLSVNGREILTGTSMVWSRTIDMQGEVNHFPIEAVCDRDSKLCDVTIAGIHAASLKF